jgi:hypothetical protein
MGMYAAERSGETESMSMRGSGAAFGSREPELPEAGCCDILLISVPVV